MKRLLLAALVLGLLSAGCAKKDVVKPSDQAGQDRQVAGQKDTDARPTDNKIKPQDGSVVSSDTAETITIQKLQSMIKDIHFDYDKYDVKTQDKSTLRDNADVLMKNKNLRVSIEGHCDERGTNEYNLALGDKRANAVKAYMLSLGMPAGRMDTISYGEERPLCKESTEACWATNRRAHFALTGGGK